MYTIIRFDKKLLILYSKIIVTQDTKYFLRLHSEILYQAKNGVNKYSILRSTNLIINKLTCNNLFSNTLVANLKTCLISFIKFVSFDIFSYQLAT